MRKILGFFLILISLLFSFGEQTQTTSLNNFDNHIKNIPSSELISIDKLTKHLIKPAKTQKEKAFLIYKWICLNISYDTQKYFSGNYRTYGDPAEVTFKTKKSVCEGYARLYKKMCDIAGLESVYISGYSKGFGYDPTKGLPRNADHAWNAVKIDGTWYLVESTWGAGHIDDKTKQFEWKYNEYWFMTPPEQFIVTHLPEENKWQLLSQKISKEEFLRRAKFTPEFFTYNFDHNGNDYAWLSANKTMVLTYKCPEDIAVISRLLSLSGKELNDQYTLVKRKGDSLEAITSFPYKGEFLLRIFAKPINRKGNYDTIAEYVVSTEKSNNYKKLVKSYEQYSVLGFELDDQSPIYSQLETGKQYFFKIKAPKALDMAIINTYDNSWVYLKKQEGYYEGWAPIKHGKVSLSAKFPENDNYWTVLEYNGI